MKKIVMVDDHWRFLESQKKHIEQFGGIKCDIFTSPLSAFKYIEEQKDVDVLITDYRMSQMNGFELVKNILEKLPNLRVILSSSESNLSDDYEEYSFNSSIIFIEKFDINLLKYIAC